jgi:primosomal protein N' (replication factor Y)
VIVGTREIVLWPLGELGLMVVMDEGRRAMKAPQTPTLHVRELVRRRSAIERLGVMFTGTVPTAEVLGTGVEIDDLPGRAWPLVEVADRAEEPPGAGVVLERTRRAVTAMVKAGERVFVFVSRRGYAPAFRCINCGEMRQCAACESGPGRGDTCDRCGAGVGPCRECSGRRFAPLGAAVGRVVDDLARSVGDHVGEAGQGRLVTVGTERDLPAIEPGALAVVIDADSMILAPNYRATEDALRIMSRVATKVRRGSGHRCVVQTAMAHHPVITALRHGGPESFMAEVLEQRMSAGFPPSGEVLAIEIAPGATRVDTELRAAAGDATVLGPADQGGRSRWLVQGRDLRPLRIRLRSLVQDWRDAGLRVRVDADPIDL